MTTSDAALFPPEIESLRSQITLRGKELYALYCKKSLYGKKSLQCQNESLCGETTCLLPAQQGKPVQAD